MTTRFPEPNPTALAFRRKLGLLLNETLEECERVDTDDCQGSQAAVLGLLFAEAVAGCKQSGIPLTLAIELLRHSYNAEAS